MSISACGLRTSVGESGSHSHRPRPPLSLVSRWPPVFPLTGLDRTRLLALDICLSLSHLASRDQLLTRQVPFTPHSKSPSVRWLGGRPNPRAGSADPGSTAKPIHGPSVFPSALPAAGRPFPVVHSSWPIPRGSFRVVHSLWPLGSPRRLPSLRLECAGWVAPNSADSREPGPFRLSSCAVRPGSAWTGSLPIRCSASPWLRIGPRLGNLGKSGSLG